MTMTISRRTFLVASSSLAGIALVRPVLAQSGWEAHLAKLSKAVKCRPALYGQDGVQWAGHAQVKATAEEIKYLVGGFKTPSVLFASGPKIEGEKYMTTRADERVVVIKHGTHGGVFIKTAKTIVACLFDEATVTPAAALVATNDFAQYMKKLGF
jgi:profilin